MLAGVPAIVVSIVYKGSMLCVCFIVSLVSEHIKCMDRHYHKQYNNFYCILLNILQVIWNDPHVL